MLCYQFNLLIPLLEENTSPVYCTGRPCSQVLLGNEEFSRSGFLCQSIDVSRMKKSRGILFMNG